MANKIKPDFRIVSIDETHHWAEEIQARGKVFGVYLVDFNLHVHCCELTPSYELTFLYTVTEAKNEADRDAFQDEIDCEQRMYGESVIYVHTNWKFDQVVKASLFEDEAKAFAKGELSRDELTESMHEYYVCNHAI